MTPKQLHALEWATRIARNEMRIAFGKEWEESETKRHADAADAALAYAWREYRAAQAERRASAPRRMLQRAGLK